MDKSEKPDKFNTRKSDKSDRILQITLCNSILVPYFRRIFVQTNLFFNERYLTSNQTPICITPQLEIVLGKKN